MLIQNEFAKFHLIAEAALYDAAQSRGGFSTVKAADDALRVLEDHVNEMDRALVVIHDAISAASP